ncbi:MAG: N-acetylmuramoyl-L-alanine amidase [Oscillospiraceae bacterium]|nr:N-acetylmuramoyl-L-alanine amidase [Oscillospiraceae bacterium]
MEIIQDIIKIGSVNRPGAKNSCTSITIHDTANKKAGANARSHAKYIKTLNSRTSWHYTVDDKEIYRHIPDEEKSYHTSSTKANENSISIELCVNSDGNFEKTVDNAVWLVRELMSKHKIAPSAILSHRDWTGKNCPETLFEYGWEEFVSRCSEPTGKSGFITVDELKKLGYDGIAF